MFQALRVQRPLHQLHLEPAQRGNLRPEERKGLIHSGQPDSESQLSLRLQEGLVLKLDLERELHFIC